MLHLFLLVEPNFNKKLLKKIYK